MASKVKCKLCKHTTAHDFGYWKDACVTPNCKCLGENPNPKRPPEKPASIVPIAEEESDEQMRLRAAGAFLMLGAMIAGLGLSALTPDDIRNIQERAKERATDKPGPKATTVKRVKNPR